VAASRGLAGPTLTKAHDAFALVHSAHRDVANSLNVHSAANSNRGLTFLGGDQDWRAISVRIANTAFYQVCLTFLASIVPTQTTAPFLTSGNTVTLDATGLDELYKKNAALVRSFVVRLRNAAMPTTLVNLRVLDATFDPIQNRSSRLSTRRGPCSWTPC